LIYEFSEMAGYQNYQPAWNPGFSGGYGNKTVADIAMEDMQHLIDDHW
jgi:hypothetical protein